jgi:4-amino-4-deoxy-L-arabinose transferase-like glycosyltransferase
LGAALIRVGIPEFQALYCVNFLCYFLSLLVLSRMATRRVDRAFNCAERNVDIMAPLFWMLTPGFCQYLVRGNHEHPLALTVVMTVFVVIGAQKRNVLASAGLWSLALLVALFIKGLAGCALILIFALLFLFFERNRRTLLVFSIGLLVAAIGWIAFEQWYASQTGVHFLNNYLSVQVSRSVGEIGMTVVFQKLYNLIYYLGRPLWFFAPWIYFILYALYRRVRLKEPLGNDVRWWCGLLVATVFIVGFSFADRKADRYIFPCYPILALSCSWLMAHATWRWCEAVRSFVQRHRAWIVYAMPLSLVVGVCIEMYFGTYHYRFIHLWPGA